MIFEAKVKYTSGSEDSIGKLVSEQYLIEADSFASAEYGLKENIAAYSQDGNIDILALKKSKVEAIHFEKNDDILIFFAVTFKMQSIDENNGKIKATMMTDIFNADNIDEATKLANDVMSQFIVDTQIVSIKETKFMDYIFESE